MAHDNAGKQPKTDLSIVVVNYNTRDYLRACLHSVLDHSDGLRIEVIVVDNASTDGSTEMVRGEFPGVKLLAMEKNTWFCGGNNLGIGQAQGRYVLLLNPDTVVGKNALIHMVEFMDRHGDYRGVTGQLRYPHGAVQRTCSRIPTYSYLILTNTPVGWILRGWRKRVSARHWYDKWGRDRDHDIEVMPGSCTLMRPGGDLLLDENLLLYFPEDDLARRKPGKYRFLSESRIIHYEKAATQTWLATRIYFRDMLVYSRKHHGVWRTVLLWFLSRPLLWAMAFKRFWRDHIRQLS